MRFLAPLPRSQPLDAQGCADRLLLGAAAVSRGCQASCSAPFRARIRPALIGVHDRCARSEALR